MENSKLLKTIALFTAREKDRLKLFISSPYFVTPKEQPIALQLLDIICLFLDNNNQQQLDKKNVYAQLYPNQIFISGKLDKLMSKLTKYIHSFIVTEYPTDPQSTTNKQLALAHFYHEKKNDKEFAIAIQNSKKQQHKIQAKSIDDYYVDFKIHQQELVFQSHHNTRNIDINLPNAARSFDLYYVVQRLRYLFISRVQRLHIAISSIEAPHLYPSLVQIIKHENFDDILIVKAYLYALEVFEQTIEKSFVAFEHLKELLHNHRLQIAADDLHLLKSFLRSYSSIYLNNQSSFLYTNSVFDLYKSHLQDGDLYFDDKIHPVTLKNIVTLALETNQTEWTYDFLITHQHKIMGKQNTQEVYNFNLAYYYFHIQQYDQALDLLSGNYDDTYYKLAAKRLEIKILFEQDSPLLDYKIEAFKVFIFRQNKKHLPEQHLKLNNHFIDCLRKIIHPKTLGNTTRIQKLNTEIQQYQFVAERKWLCQKLEQL